MLGLDPKPSVATDHYGALAWQTSDSTVPMSYITRTPSTLSSFRSMLYTIPIEIWMRCGSLHVTVGDNSFARGKVFPLHPMTPPLDSYLKIGVLRPDADIKLIVSEVEQSRYEATARPSSLVASTWSIEWHCGSQAAMQPIKASTTITSRISSMGSLY